ncbi:MAG: hypothetical protein KC931_26870 [Candidatus Omnitrophica bacterium]|nr:hypothetical protein [Candidatus Omnitrophota bacterium]MCB1231610.1 hypothetical protein [Verrucomicrobiae bacterium]
MDEQRENQPTKKLVFRWSSFGIVVLLAVLTLVMLIRSMNEEWEVVIRSPKSSAARVDYWYVRSGWGCLAYDVRSYNPAVSKRSEWFIMRRHGYPDPRILDHPRRISYLWVLALECVALFFLVPSVLSKAGRG